MLVSLEDLRLNALLSGPANAPPLVLIHGLGLDLSLWDGLMPYLPRYQVLRFDLRGHGASERPAAPYAMGTLIRDVERLMLHFGLTNAVVLGAGEGGLIAQGLAVKRLDLVRALGLTGSAARFGNPDAWQARLARLMRDGPDLDDECATLLGPNWRGSPQAGAVRAQLERTSTEGWEGLASATATADFYQTTSGLSLPMLVLAGGDDRKAPPDLQRETADLVAGSEFQLLRGAGHLAMLTQPAAFAAALNAFLMRIGHV